MNHLNIRKIVARTKAARLKSIGARTGNPRLILALLATGILAVFILGNAICGKPDKHHAYGVPIYEIYPETEMPVRQRPGKPDSLLPKIAIIIDDIGYDLEITKKFLRLDAPITFSVLPQSPQGNQIIEKLEAEGAEIMLHMPMEPNEYPRVNPGPGAIYTFMSPQRMVGLLNRHLEAYPMVRGVNNHMGSKMTAFPACMYTIISVLKKRHLFFVDSVTTPKSICRSTARSLQIPFAERDVFLDHMLDVRSIRRQMDRLVQLAWRHGEAIGIGHPHSETLRVLREALPGLKRELHVVPASQLVHIIG